MGGPGGLPARRAGRRSDRTSPRARVAAGAQPELMTTAVRERPAPSATGHEGGPARRAMARWAGRLSRREWGGQAPGPAVLPGAQRAYSLRLRVARTASN